MIIDTIAKQLFFSTVMIRTIVPGGQSTGTGFIYNVATGDDQFAPLLVTNKHVLHNAITGRIGFVKNINGQPATDQYAEFDFGEEFASQWVGHPDPEIDVAVMPLGPCINQLVSSGFTPFFIGLPSDLFPSDAVVEILDAVEEVTFIGYPSGLVDSANHTPIIRRGITATPIEQDWNGKPQFLIDASVFPGSSGSPVFLMDLGGYHSKGNFIIGNRVYFLGILAAVHHHTALAEIIETAQKSQAVVQQFMDLGIVYKWRTVEDCIEAVCTRYGIQREKIAEVGPTPN